jgi:predicted  nucleic acid-binding Zn-ribbon protein
LERTAAAAKADVEARLVQAQSELAELAAGGEALEAERDGLEEEIVTLTRERDEQAGIIKQQADELAERAREIERERLAAETARVEQAKGALRTEALAERLVEQQQEQERLRADLEGEREARRQAEQRAAVLEARLGDCQERIRLAEQRSAQADERARTVEREQQRLTMQIQAQQAALDQTVREVEAAKKAAAEQQERTRRAIEEAAELRGQLKSSMEIQTKATTSKNSK